MKFTVGSSAISVAIGRVGLAVSRKVSIPILINVLITADERGVRLYGTDTILGASSRVDAKVAQSGQTTVDEQRLRDIVTNLPGGKKVTFSYVNEKLRVQCGKTIYNLLVTPPQEFPQPLTPNDKGSKIQRTDLIDLLKWTEHAMSSDDSRPHLYGARLTVDKGQMMVQSTDSRRLAIGTKEYGKHAPLTVFIPYPSVGGLRKFCESLADEEIQFCVSGTHLFCWGESAGLSTRITDTKVLDGTKLIQKPSTKVSVGREGLMSALTRMRVISEDPVRMYFDKDSKTLEITSSNPQAGEGKETLPAGISGKDVEVLLSSGSIQDALNAAPSKHMSIFLNGPLNPVTIEPQDESGLTMILMPLKDPS